MTESETSVSNSYYYWASTSLMLTQFCPLLELPAELRNNIWELAATENEAISINGEMRVPGFLSSCYQIRKEALALWLLSNEFKLVIHSAKRIKQLVQFEEFCMDHVRTKKMKVKITFADQGDLFDVPADNQTLQDWIFHVRDGGHWIPKREDSKRKAVVLLTANLELAQKTRDLDMEGFGELISTLCWSMNAAQKVGF